MPESPYRAVIFDLGGVVFPSPFEAFDRYDRRAGLPAGTVRAVVRTSSERGAWAALERGELTLAQFHAALEAEGAAAGHAIDAAEIMALVAAGTAPRPEMLTAVGRIRAAGLRAAGLTNNWAGNGTSEPHGAALAGTGAPGALDVFDVLVESSVEGLRKPDPRIYELTCARLGVEPAASVFLDDLGINLKPARALGMATIKVTDPADALRELEALLGFPLA